MEDAGLHYSADFILGLPGETEEDLIGAIRLLSGRKGLRRASIFWLEYLPGVALTDFAQRTGLIGPRERENIDAGRQQNYLAHGSVEDPQQIRHLKTYHLLFRLLPITPARVMEFLLRYRLHQRLRVLSVTPVIILVDLFVSVAKRDYYSLWAIRTYAFEITRRLKTRLYGRAEFAYKSSPLQRAPGWQASSGVAASLPQSET